MTKDCNGRRVYKTVRREPGGTWSANVWWGAGCVTDVHRRYGYPTRAAARAADIGDNGRRAR